MQTVGWPRRLRIMFGVHFAEMAQYRAEIALWAIATTLPLIMMGVWAEAGESGKFDFTRVEVFRYFISVFLIRQFTVIWAIHHFEWLVVSGRLSPMLLHPVDPCLRIILMHLGEQVTRLPFAMAIVGLFLWLYPETLSGGAEGGAWWPGWWNILLALVACYTAFLLRYFMQYVLCMAAFWYERVAAMDAIIYLPYMFLSGLVFPFEALPETVRTVLLWTPFPYMVWFPAAMLVHGEAPLVRGFTIMIAWTLVFFALYRWLWKKGLKHYSAMGA
jgi:ABC-2 type transport system permease protein